MAVTERLMGAGNFSVSFSQEFTPTAIIQSIKEWGHIVITPQEVDIDTLSDSEILSASRYTGIVLNRTLEEGVVSINGQGLELYMGDGSAKGMVIAESNNVGKVRTFTGTTLAETLFNSTAQTNKPLGIMRDEAGNAQAITQGTITNPTATYTGAHFVETSLSALKFICEVLNVEYKVNSNGTLDAGPAANLFEGVGTNQPNSIVVKTAYGQDPEFEGVVPQGLRTEFDATDWVSRVDFTGEVGFFDIATDVAGEANLSSNPYKDLHGNALKRVGLVQEPDVPEANLNTRATTLLNELARIKKVLNLDLEQYEVTGDMKPGDFIYAFDPDVGFKDTATDATAESRDLYEITFRGQTITPVKIRVLGITFPITTGMGCYYRDKDGNYTDITEYVQYESGSAQVELGDLIRTIGDDLRFSEFSLSKSTAGAFSIPNLPATPTLQSGTYLNATGESSGFIRVTVAKPTNIDGSQITDGSHYKVRYKKITDNEYSYQNFPFTGVSSESLLLQDMAVGLTYDVGVAAVDKSGFKAMSAYDGTGSDLYTNTSSVNANFASNARIEIEKDGQAPSKPKIVTLAAGPLRVQVSHSLGKDGTDGSGNAFGDFTLEGDLDYLAIHAVTQSGNTQNFTIAESNKIGEVRVTAGNLLQQIPVISTIELSDSANYYFRIVAVDKSGNASDPSDGQLTNADLIAEANIADATITTAKIGDAQITTAKIGDAQITTAKVNDLSADKLTAGTIDASQITVTNLNATNLSSGTINADRIASDSITADKIAANTISTTELNFTPVSNSNIVASINASSEGITIDADTLNLTGTLSVGDALDIGGSDTSSFHVDTSGNMFLGAATLGAAPFKVTAAGALTATSVTVSGNISGTVDQATELTAQVTMGTNGKLRTKTGTTYIELNSTDANTITFKKSNATIGQINDYTDGSDSAFMLQAGTSERLWLYSPSGKGTTIFTNTTSNNNGNYASGGLRIAAADGNVGGQIIFGNTTPNANQIIKSNGNNVYWGNATSAGVNAIQGTGNISTNNNTGSIVINSNHSHNLGVNNNQADPNHHSNDRHNVAFGTSNINSSDVTNNSTVQTAFNHANSGHVSNNTINLALQNHTPNQHDNNEHSTDFASLSSYNNHLNNLHFSDQRLKNDVQETTFGLDFINRLRPVDFTWDSLYLDTYYDEEYFSELKSLLGNQQQGFIAQEVKQAVYDTNQSNTDFGGFLSVNITEEDQLIKDETNTTDDINKLDYLQFIGPLVKSVQQLSAKIDVLEARIDELEG